MPQMTLTWRAQPTNWWWKVTSGTSMTLCSLCSLHPATATSELPGPEGPDGGGDQGWHTLQLPPSNFQLWECGSHLGARWTYPERFDHLRGCSPRDIGQPLQKAHSWLHPMHPSAPAPLHSSGPWTTVTVHFRQRLGKGTLFSAPLSPQRGHFKGEDFLWKSSEPQQHAPLLLSPHLNHQVSNNFCFFSFLFVFT